MIDALNSPEILTKLGKLQAQGLSWESIKNTLKRENNIDASIPTLRDRFKLYCTRSAEVVAGNDIVKQEFTNVILDSVAQLKRVNEFCNKIMDEPKSTNDDILGACREILNQLYFQYKILTPLQQNIDWSKVSRIEYSKISIENLDNLENSGYVILIKRPGVGDEVEHILKTSIEEISEIASRLKQMNKNTIGIWYDPVKKLWYFKSVEAEVSSDKIVEAEFTEEKNEKEENIEEPEMPI